MGDKIESQKNIKHTFYFGGSIMGYTDPPLFLLLSLVPVIDNLSK